MMFRRMECGVEMGRVVKRSPMSVFSSLLFRPLPCNVESSFAHPYLLWILSRYNGHDLLS